MGTSEFGRLSGLSDQELEHELSSLLASGARVEARIVFHLAEVEERRLHLKAAYSSLFDYCQRRLRLSESEAFYRITAARLARKFPLIFQLLESRSIHLTALRLLRDHLTDQNHRELLAAASGKSKREVEMLIATLAPRPDIPSRIRKLPAPRRAALTSPSVAAGFNPVPAPSHCSAEPSTDAERGTEARRTTASAPSLASMPLLASAPSLASTELVNGPARTAASETATAASTQASPLRGSEHSAHPRPLEPLSCNRYRLQLTASQALKDKLERARDLMSHANPSGELALVVEKALDALLERLEKERFAQTRRPQSTLRMLRKTEQAHTALRNAPSPTTQQVPDQQHSAQERRREHIPNEVLRTILARDGRRCTYVDGEGQRCPATAFLQVHHEHAHALGGPSTLENLRIVCGAHNRWLAEQDFGRAHQRRFIESRAPGRSGQPNVP
jgi:5-methylcytosine-specific restriction endonuclease McrA